MTIDKIQMFLAVCYEKTTTKAAEKLFITQPAISQGIKELETELGVSLFKRIGKRLEISNEGELFIPVAQDYVNAHNKAQALFQQEKREPLRIGCTVTIATYVLPQIITAYEAKHDVLINVQVANVNAVKQMLDHNDIDVALIEGSTDVEHYAYNHLGTFDLSFVASPFYLESNNNILDFLVREEGSSYRSSLTTLCAMNGINPEIKWIGNNNEVILNAALNHQGIALLPHEAIQTHIKQGTLIYVPFKNKSHSEPYGVMVNKHMINRIENKSFLQFLAQR